MFLIDPRKLLLMITQKVNFFVSFLIFLAFFCAQPTIAAEKIVLQLRWDNQFQFAGYYAAKWQGYYKDAGLDVEIRSAIRDDQTILKATDEVTKGNADFGIGAADILIAKDKGAPLVVTAVIFQQSASTFYTRADSEFRSPKDFLHAKVARNVNDLIDVELQAMLKEEGIDPNLVKPYPHITGFEHFLTGKVDIVPGYSVTAPYVFQREGISVRQIKPSSYGIDFYGDSLFTSRKLVEDDPMLVKRFTEASLKGWQYALEHSEEIAKKISENIPRIAPIDNISDFNRYQIEAVKNLTHYPMVDLGHINPLRWRHMHTLLKNLGIVKGEIDLDTFLYDDHSQKLRRTNQIKNALLLSTSIILTFLGVALFFVYLLNRTVKAKTELLHAHISNSPLAIIEFDRLLRITRWSSEAQNVFGWSAEEILGKSITEFRWVYEEDINNVQQESIALRDGSRPRSLYKNRNYRKDGSVIECEWYNSAIYNDRGKLLSIFSQILDVTARNQAINSLQKMEGTLRLAQEAAEIGSWWYDPTTQHMEWTDQMFHVFGMKTGQEAPAFEEHKNIIHPDDWERFSSAVTRAIAGGTGFDLELRVKYPTDEIGYVHTISKAIKNSDGTVTKLIGTSQNITERKKAERKQLFLQKRLEALWKISSLQDAKYSTICDNILHEIVAITESHYGFYGFLNDEEDTMTVFSWSRSVMSDCAMGDKPLLFPIEKSGIWGNAVRTRQPFILNDYQDACENKKGFPAGHVALSRVLSVPIIISGKIVAVAAVANKEAPYDEDDVKQLESFLTNSQIIIGKKNSEEKLRMSERILAKSQEIAHLGSWHLDIKQNILSWSEEEYRIFGRSADTFAATYEAFLEAVHPDDREMVNKAYTEAIKNNLPYECVHRIIRSDGEVRIVFEKSEDVVDEHGETIHSYGFTQDITEQKKLEEEKAALEKQLLQGQKMEAIGTLAGGIAHDFNNILGALLGYAEMIQEDAPAGSIIANDIDQVVAAANRAKDLVKQILAFSRQSSTEIMPMQITGIIKETLRLLRSSLPTTIQIEQDIANDTGLIQADPTQIHQIMMNLCTNAYHSMEETGGTLSISLQKVNLLAQDLLEHAQTKPGQFAQLSVKDTGTGIPAEILGKVFDPYFTTKETGKGTGMGLAIVHGIVKNYQGFVTCSSEPGNGTVFHVFIPLLDDTPIQQSQGTDLIEFGNEHILFIDDELVLAEMVKNMLERLGYRVTLRTSSIEALTTFQNHPETFDLIITDQTMPGMTGSDLSRRILQIRPTMPIILCTGYSNLISEEKVRSLGIKELAMKPLAKRELAMLIRKVLREGTPVADGKEPA